MNRPDGTVITREMITNALGEGKSVAFNIADLQDTNDTQGRSYRQVNAEKKHSIPLGALVEIEDSGERLYVVHHGRDCDQTPLYFLSLQGHTERESEHFRNPDWFGGYSEFGLTVIRLPENKSS